MKIYIMFLMGFVSCICFTDAITDWTYPVINTKDGSVTINVDENQAEGVAIVTLAVNGAGTPTFSIVTQPASAKLKISSGDLVLDTGKMFDFETETSYIVEVECVDSDDNTDAGTATATITLSIQDVNEEPVFASSQYVVTIPDGADAGTTLTTVMAVDPDDGNTITYALQAAGNTNSVFKIGTDGEITVDTGKTLDAATVGGYQLVVEAVDDATPPKTGTATVWVAVMTCSSSAALIACMITVLVALVATLL